MLSRTEGFCGQPEGYSDGQDGLREYGRQQSIPGLYTPSALYQGGEATMEGSLKEFYFHKQKIGLKTSG